MTAQSHTYVAVSSKELNSTIVIDKYQWAPHTYVCLSATLAVGFHKEKEVVSLSRTGCIKVFDMAYMSDASSSTWKPSKQGFKYSALTMCGEVVVGVAIDAEDQGLQVVDVYSLKTRKLICTVPVEPGQGQRHCGWCTQDSLVLCYARATLLVDLANGHVTEVEGDNQDGKILAGCGRRWMRVKDVIIGNELSLYVAQ